jgi:ABC-type sugar transport system substrate-binding protein
VVIKSINVQEGEKSKMKKRKTSKVLVVLLAVLMVFTFGIGMAACENEGGGDADTPTDTDDQTGITIPTEFKGKDVFTEDTTIWHITLSTAGVTNRMVEYAFDYVTKYYPNINVVMQDAQYNPENQVNFLNEALTQGVDAVIIEAMDPGATQAPIEALEAAGIPVITANLNTFAVHSLHIQGQDYFSGQEAADVLAEATDGKGIAVSIDGPQQQAETNRMTVGFQDQLAAKYPGIEFKENSYTDNWDAQLAQTNMAALIQKYPDITMVYCASDDLANGVVSAVKAAKKEKQIKVYGSMGMPDALKRIQNGEQFGTYFSDNYVEFSTALYQALYFIQNGISVATMGNTTTPVIDQPTTPVTKDNVDTIIGVSHWKEADPDAWK